MYKSASNQGSEGVCVEAETSDGSDSTDHISGINTEVPIVVSSESSEVAPSSGDATDENLLGHSEDDEEDNSDHTDTSTHTIIIGTQSDNDEDFNPDLPSKCGNQTQTALEKELVDEVDKTEGKSEKIVPMTAATSSESKMDSDPSPIVQQFLALAKEVNATPPIMALAKNENVTIPASDVGASLDDKDQ